MRTAASRAGRSHVPRDRGLRDGEGTRRNQRHSRRTHPWRDIPTRDHATPGFCRWQTAVVVSSPHAGAAVRQRHGGVSGRQGGPVVRSPFRGWPVAPPPRSWLRAGCDACVGHGWPPRAYAAQGLRGVMPRSSALPTSWPPAPGRSSRRARPRRTASTSGFPRWSSVRPGWPARNRGPGRGTAPPRHTPCTRAPCWRCRP